MKKIVFTTIGSLGDLHPIMGIAHELKKMGHRPIIAASEYYRQYVIDSGLEFHKIRPSINHEDPEIIKSVLDTKKGPEILHKKYIFPELQNSIDDLIEVSRDADLIVSSVLTYFVPIVSHITGKPWVNAIMVPISMWSAYDPPILAPIPFLGKMRFLHHRIHHWLLKALFKISEPWAAPLKKLRLKYKMDAGKNPFWEGLYQGKKTLCLWSDHFYSPKPDWPKNAKTTGFVFYDPKQLDKLDDKIQQFRENHKKICVFTLGSTTVQNPEEFLSIFIETAKELSAGCIITTGKKHIEHYRKLNQKNILFIDYAPYSLLFPIADMVIHQGGVGTTAQCLYAGVPQIVLPFCMDQFDNGYRIKRLGVGDVIERKNLNKSKLLSTIATCFENKEFNLKGLEISKLLKEENGAVEGAKQVLAVIAK